MFAAIPASRRVETLSQEQPKFSTIRIMVCILPYALCKMLLEFSFLYRRSAAFPQTQSGCECRRHIYYTKAQSMLLDVHRVGVCRYVSHPANPQCKPWVACAGVCCGTSRQTMSTTGEKAVIDWYHINYEQVCFYCQNFIQTLLLLRQGIYMCVSVWVGSLVYVYVFSVWLVRWGSSHSTTGLLYKT